MKPISYRYIGYYTDTNTYTQLYQTDTDTYTNTNFRMYIKPIPIPILILIPIPILGYIGLADYSSNPTIFSLFEKEIKH